jgi:hypothetical protein
MFQALHSPRFYYSRIADKELQVAPNYVIVSILPVIFCISGTIFLITHFLFKYGQSGVNDCNVLINNLKLSVNYMYHLLSQSVTPHVVLYDFQQKQR